MGIRRYFLNISLWSVILQGFIAPGILRAQDDDAGKTLPLFQSEELLHLVLQADFDKVFSVTDDSTYFPAMISITDNDGHDRNIEIKIRTRGKTRRQKDFCKFAPLRLNFPKKEVKNTPFEGQNVIKLVTHCNKSDQYEQNTMIEYLIYKAFNVLTDSSFKVRPAMITYIYSDKKSDTVSKFAFFIEREKLLADRLNGTEIKSEKIHPDRLDPLQTCLVDMFQYMIGNTDYSIYELHNTVLITDSTAPSKALAIPYDFDWSGLVSANYAEPNPLMGTEKVTERVYRGLKKEPEIVFHVIDKFNAKKMEIYRLFENFELLDRDRKKRAISYLDDFYYIINNDRSVKTQFFDQARIEE